MRWATGIKMLLGHNRHEFRSTRKDYWMGNKLLLINAIPCKIVNYGNELNQKFMV